MMNFWTIEGLKPDADIPVLVITDKDERTMAVWDGEAWLTDDSEVPLSGTVTHWCLLEEIASPHDIIRENFKQDQRIAAKQDAYEDLRNQYDNKCDGCHLLKFSGDIRCSDCCEMVSEAATVEMPDYKRLCPTCAAKKFREVLS
ncbi:MAG: hypothetical protein AB7E95_06315 [Kiritimatiellales bacterium]